MNIFQPVEKSNRLQVVDALRGLALFGIICANVPFSTNANELYAARPFIVGTPGTDNFLQLVIDLFVNKKFITIFSMLFGFGFYVQLKSAEKNGIDFRTYYLRRMILLLMIGCIHAYFFWFGDILRDYAICGIFLLLVYKWPSKKLLITAIVFMVFITGAVFILNSALGVPHYSYDTSIVYKLPLTRSYFEYLKMNATIDPIVNFLQDSPVTLVFCFGNMLFGFWLGKTGFFHEPQRFRKQRNKLIIVGITLGISCSYLFGLITSGKIELSPALIWLPFVIVAGLILQSLCYISLFINLFQRNWWKRFLSLFASIGKMALSNYVFQTFFYLVVFYHWIPFFNLYGKITITETYLVVLILFAIQVLFSKWWMSRHDQGPLEKVWKDLSYRSSKKIKAAAVSV